MKRTSLLLLLLAFFVTAKAQETVTLTFTANTTGNVHSPFDAVNVTNVTRGWTETLAFPDTILVLNSTVGLSEQFVASFRLGEAHPNPFKDEAIVSLETPVTGEVCIQVFRIDGTVIIKSYNHLEAGSHRLKVSLRNPGMAFLVVTSAQGQQVVRLLSTGNGSGDHVTVEPVSKASGDSNQVMRGDAMGDFQPGDMMRYTAVLYDGANTIYSNTITQQQFESQIVTLHFDLTKPAVTTNQVIDITQTTATGVGNVNSTGGVSVTERGICWSTSHNPATNGNHASNGTGSGTYTVQMNGLTAGTTYYVRAYAINMFGIAYGNEESFTTIQIPNYTISVSSNPSNGGSVSGGGSYQQGLSCTVIATAANGYSFTNWTENGGVVSTNPNYTFTVNNDRSLVANFSVQVPNTFTINASPNPSNGGVVTGGGTYQQGQSCTVSAVANTGYTFLQWTENGNQVSTNANYTFTVIDNRTLVAQFQAQSYTIIVSADPANGGSASGGGTYQHGQYCTVSATANSGYAFVNWTENGTQVSTDSNYSFTVSSNRTLVANFVQEANTYTISVIANPIEGGSVSGGGSYQEGQLCTVIASAASGYSFVTWTENGNPVSTNANYTFTVSDNRVLVANFANNSTSYFINASVDPSDYGFVTGGGSYYQGQTCTLHAISYNGFTFIYWKEDDVVVSTNNYYSFMVNGDRDLVAYFTEYSNHEYVDLGLPSGTMWATCNVGATTPEEFGNHFSWGETLPYSHYNWSYYLYCNGTNNSLTKYCNNPDYGYYGFTDDLITLQIGDDAATKY